ncbi:MAG: AcvB/VirJ family lysyl-phosphatidylglycerol hydrolase [Caulobacteraceae bacterium]|nr:AcvB/VirJ family lysyl-phosphatidylglycerol hydrolase [Caulobacteraceae bacterium]
MLAFAVVIAGGLSIGLAVALSRDSAQPGAGGQVAGAQDQLPVFAYPARAAPGGALVIFYSGDNGWSKADRGFARALVAQGDAVVGVDSLRYFLTPKSSSGAAGDLTTIIRRYGGQWGRQRVVLAGYSFGASALPLIAQGLPNDVRRRVVAIALVGPDHYARLVFRPYHWLDLAWPGSTPLASAVDSLGDVPVTCIQGAADTDGACSLLAGRGARSVTVPGGHRYKGAYVAVAQAILSAVTVRPH